MSLIVHCNDAQTVSHFFCISVWNPREPNVKKQYYMKQFFHFMLESSKYEQKSLTKIVSDFKFSPPPIFILHFEQFKFFFGWKYLYELRCTCISLRFRIKIKFSQLFIKNTICILIFTLMRLKICETLKIYKYYIVVSFCYNAE